MKIEEFAMERWQSIHEHDVKYNLSDSGVHPLTLGELADDLNTQTDLLEMPLGYTQTNGSVALRRAISDLYPDADIDNILVTTGGIEANFLSVWSLVEPGDEVVVMTPNYMQIWGLASALGAKCRSWRLRPDEENQRWVADLEELRDLVNERTRFIAICNPNNPTGARYDSDCLEEIVQIAQAHGTWIISDEIYQGSELAGETTPTCWSRYERVIVTNSLSKTYGLPGLRLGWLVAPRERCADLWKHHDYTTIAPGAISDRLGVLALRTDRRTQLIERGRGLLRRNAGLVRRWLDENPEAIHAIFPQAGAMLFLRYTHPINSSALAERLRLEKSVLVVPGDQFGMDGWLRLGFGGEPDCIHEALKRVDELLKTIEPMPD
jgi:aspartate/methionine/tyrosine aminotransferase